MSNSEIEDVICGQIELTTAMMNEFLSHLQIGRLDLDEYGTNILTSLDEIKSTEKIKENCDIDIKYHFGYEVAKLLLSTIETAIMICKDNICVRVDELLNESEEVKKSEEIKINNIKKDFAKQRDKQYKKKYQIYVSTTNKDGLDHKCIFSAILTISTSGIYHIFSLKKYISYDSDKDITIDLFSKRFSFNIEIKKNFDIYTKISFKL